MWKTIENTGSGSGRISIRCSTAVQFYYRRNQYELKQIGTSAYWEKFRSAVGDQIIDVFWADWIGSYGSQQIQAMSMGVFDLCTLRMDYHPDLYDLLRRKEVLVIKNAAPDAVIHGEPVRNHPDVYKLWSAVDDIRNMRRIMEFKVRRFEEK